MPQRRPGPSSGEQARQDREEAAARIREALVGPAEDRAPTIARLGGTTRVAAIVGRSVRTVQRWAAGTIRAPRADALGKLNQADVRDRATRRGLDPDARPGTPRAPKFQARGQVAVQGPSDTPTYAYYRRIGAEGGIELLPDTLSSMLDHLASSNDEAALQDLERQQTRDYADCGDNYDAAAGLGFRFETLDEVSFYSDNDDRLF